MQTSYFLRVFMFCFSQKAPVLPPFEETRKGKLASSARQNYFFPPHPLGFPVQLYTALRGWAEYLLWR